jgi:hypothetical protein
MFLGQILWGVVKCASLRLLKRIRPMTRPLATLLKKNVYTAAGSLRIPEATFTIKAFAQKTAKKNTL